MSLLEGMNAEEKVYLLGMITWVNTNLIEVFSCGSHLLPGFIKQLDADTEKLLPCSVMSEEHGVVVIAALISLKKKRRKKNTSTVKLNYEMGIRATVTECGYIMNTTVD